MPREQFQSLTEPMYYILMSLQDECCGVDIMEKVRGLSGGRVQVGPGNSVCASGKIPGGGYDRRDKAGRTEKVV